jgi:hypothetical protein
MIDVLFENHEDTGWRGVTFSTRRAGRFADLDSAPVDMDDLLWD